MNEAMQEMFNQLGTVLLITGNPASGFVGERRTPVAGDEWRSRLAAWLDEGERCTRAELDEAIEFAYRVGRIETERSNQRSSR